jgi:hypothetical protein
MHSPHKYTAVDYMGHRPGLCDICNEAEGAPIHVYTFAGLETCDQDREAALAISQREEMETRLRSTRGDISARSGKMERHSPLFFGTGDNPLLW